jgi:predicted enzyme related to lactoylglutathione lyase
MKLAYTRIVTKDVAALTKFYQEVTGITPKILHEAYVEFPVVGSSLAISSQNTMDAHGVRAASAASNRSVVLDFQVEDVDREHARIREFVSDIVLEPTNQPWGNRSMMFRDTDGNLINFYAPLGEIGEQGEHK